MSRSARHPSPRTLVTVLLAVAVLVLGANTVALASTGHPFLLGRVNKEAKPTSLTTTGKGPALALKSAAKFPSLSVTSRALVKNLNASLLGGKTPDQLSPITQDLVQPGASGSALEDTQLFSVALPKGDYSLQVHALVQQTDTSMSSYATCLALDQSVFDSISTMSSTVDYSGIYLDINQQSTDPGFGTLFQGTTLHVPVATTLYYGCLGTNDTILQPPEFALRALNGVETVHGTAHTVAKQAGLAKLGSLR